MDATVPTTTDLGDLASLAESFEVTLHAERKSPATIRSYREGVRQLRDFLVASGMPTAVASIKREHAEAFLAHLDASGRSPATVSARYRALRSFFTWCASEGEIPPDSSPLRHTREPAVPERPVDILTDDDFAKLLRAAQQAPRFEAARDTAWLRLLWSTGARVGEIAGLTVDDVHLRPMEDAHVVVEGKGERVRVLPLTPKAVRDLDRYLRLRRQRDGADTRPELFLGRAGRFTTSGISQRLHALCDRAGIPRLHPHQFRHTAADRWLSEGGNEVDALRLFGWRNAEMLHRRYGAKRADVRAHAAFRKMAPGDDV